MAPLTQRTDYQSATASQGRPDEGTFIRLWDQPAPNAIGVGPTDVPAMTAYISSKLPKNCPTVIVCPGGGYGALAEHEADPVAHWLNTLGIASFVLRYRLAPQYRHPSMLMDATRAIRTVRAMAGPWNLDPDRIGILGFSAGGHLASTAATLFEPADAQRPDPIDRQSSRPDIAILIYPVITLVGPFAHEGSCRNLLGENVSPSMREALSSHLRVTAKSPPTFFIHSKDDGAVPPENSRMMAAALAQYGIAYQVHLFEHGGHGYGMGGNDPMLSQWPGICAAWLRQQNFCR